MHRHPPHASGGDHPHAHPPLRVLLTAFVVTLLAAGVELAGSWRGESLFLAADAFHLLAHLGIFGVLLIPTARRSTRGEDARDAHARREDAVTITVLAIVLLIALGIAVVSVRAFVSDLHEPPQPALMLLALVGLSANLATAYLLKDPAGKFWSFRAALAHELSDGALTIVGLLGALFIKLFDWEWVDPLLSLMIGSWLGIWSVRLLAIRASRGRRAWETEEL